MKDLRTYILEAEEKAKKEVSTSKSFEFKLEGFDNAKDTIESIKELASSNEIEVETSDNSVTITITKDNVSKIDSIQDVLQQYVDIQQKSPKRSSDEQFAQKVKALVSKVNSMNDYIDELDGTSEEE